MKLIIDIPDHLYTVIKNKECTHRNVLTEAIYDGIPLDKIRAEINGLMKYYPYPMVSPYQTNNYAMLMEDEVLQIIDKYRKGEDE